jgi:hypothetical protein
MQHHVAPRLEAAAATLVLFVGAAGAAVLALLGASFLLHPH